MKLWNWTCRTLVGAHLLNKVQSDVEELRARIESRKQELAAGKRHPEWLGLCEYHIRNADAALKKYDIDATYHSLFNAERNYIFGMSDQERDVRVVSLREELGSKLGNSWRGQAARELLQPNNPSAEAVSETLMHVQTASLNEHRKLALLRRQINWLGVLIGATVMVALYTVSETIAQISKNVTPELFRTAIFMGLLGGLLSAALSTTNTDPKVKIPDARRTASITMFRALLGAAAAIPVFMLITGELLQMEIKNKMAILIFCFMAGFSERWFLSTLSNAVDKNGKGASDNGAAQKPRSKKYSK